MNLRNLTLDELERFALCGLPEQLAAAKAELERRCADACEKERAAFEQDGQLALEQP